MKKCPYCAEDILDDAVKCKHCGEWLDENSKPSIIPAANTQIIIQSKKNKGTAALLAIFLGGIGIHKFYLNQAGWGVVYILFCFTFIPAIIGFIEGLIFATMSNEEFDRRYNQFYSLKPIINQENESTIISPPSKVTKYSAVVGWSSAKLRSDSNATSSVIRHLPQGTKVEVVDQSGEWVQVNVAQMQLQGWMFKNSLDDSGLGEDENINTISPQSKPNDAEKSPFYKIVLRTCLQPEKSKTIHKLITILLLLIILAMYVVLTVKLTSQPTVSIQEPFDKSTYYTVTSSWASGMNYGEVHRIKEPGLDGKALESDCDNFSAEYFGQYDRPDLKRTFMKGCHVGYMTKAKELSDDQSSSTNNTNPFSTGQTLGFKLGTQHSYYKGDAWIENECTAFLKETMGESPTSNQGYLFIRGCIAGYEQAFGK